jgi:glycine/D-amino acid oxidase-like deaminating enzyme
VGGGRLAIRKRLDGGYTMAQRNSSISDITPDSFRQLLTFLPALASGWRELRLRVGRAFLDEWRTKRHWRMDETTPFEQMRVLDPKPSARVLAQARAVATAAFPGFAAMEVAQSWGGLMDVTPDAVPVISDVATLPGLFLATGFSGHGFGIGPGAGRLMADLVMGRAPVVDPAVFRFARFAAYHKGNDFR